MQLNDLRPAEGSRKNRKRIGRGNSSGHGTTAGNGEITKKLTVSVDKVSASAKAKIEAAGGKVETEC